MSRTVTVEVEIPDEEEIATGVALMATELGCTALGMIAHHKQKLSLAMFIVLAGLSFVFDNVEMG